MVFCENLDASDLIEQLPSSATETETETETDMGTEHESDSNQPVSRHDISIHDETRTLFTAGLILQHFIQDAPDVSKPWPPSSNCLNVTTAEDFVPIELFNFMAWCSGASDHPTLAKA